MKRLLEFLDFAFEFVHPFFFDDFSHDFTGLVAREVGFFNDFEMGGNFELSQVFTAVFSELFTGGIIGNCYESNGSFAPLRMRNADYAAFTNGSVRVDNAFDFCRINVFSTGLNHVLNAGNEFEQAVRITSENVASVEPTITEVFGVGFQVVPVTAEHHGSTDNQFAGFADSNFFAVSVQQGQSILLYPC